MGALEARRSMTVDVLNALLRRRDFRRQLIAGSLSLNGNTLAPIALAIALVAETGSATLFGIAMAASTTAMVLLLLVGGAWADRLHRTVLMGTSDAVRAIAQFYLAVRLLTTGDIGVGEVIVSQAAFGVASAFYLPASTGLTVWTVSKDLLQRANALLSLSRSIATVGGPVIAGVLVAWFSPSSAILASALLFFASAVVYFLMRLPATVESEEGESGNQFRGSVAIVRSTPWIWSSILCFMTTHFGVACLIVVGPLMFSLGDYAAYAWALVVAAVGIGYVLGDALAFRWRPRFPLRVARITELLLAPLLLGVALSYPLWLLLPLGVLAGGSMTFSDSLWLTTLQNHVPADRLSSVSAFDWLGSVVLRPVGFVVAGFIAADQHAVVLVLVFSCIAVTASRLFGLLFREVRQIEST